MQLEYKVEGGDFTRAGYASSQIKKILKQLSVDPSVIKRVVVALYEAEVNIVAHAYRGVIYADINSDGINLRLEDEGPGIPDINKAMTKGYSTASAEVREMGFGAGMGLPNISENADSFNIESVVNKGTTLRIMIKFFGEAIN
ncbi:MAG: ATP-binding protein [Rikenellaceae bacterium]